MSSFHNRARAAQLIDFEGLQWGKLRPTDIDISIDWGQKTFVFIEIKGIHQKLTVGQRIHLEGLVKAIVAGGATAYAIVAKHETKAHEDVQAQNTLVTQVFDGEKWNFLDTSALLGDTMNKLYNEHIERNGK